jgi:hypothetical protein
MCRDDEDNQHRRSTTEAGEFAGMFLNKCRIGLVAH